MAIDLSQYTTARVATSNRTRDVLQFDLDHARARDAVWMELAASSLGFDAVVVHSKARDRRSYLLRPDLGRSLEGKLERQECDAVIVVADGLSALAVHRHSGEMVARLRKALEGWKLAPVYVAHQARVAIGDDIGEQLGAEVAVVLIGERPGLTSPDSLGAYVTYGPRVGRTDAERNCVSNIRTEGLGYDAAARLIAYLMSEARTRRLSGVSLKGDVDDHLISDTSSDSAD